MKEIIIYSTKYGSVERSAKMLKSYLPEDTVPVNVKNEKEVNIEDFDTVILGGSVYMGKIQK
ncbi:MAG: flavodoxin domain-containing protein [Spirochaetota bacterium]|nr:flavodoxin domain-containing protein [Spirochaetota bacterium]